MNYKEGKFMKKKLLFFTPLMALLLAGCYARIPLPGGGGGSGSTSGTTTTDPGTETETDTDTDTDEPTPDEKYGTVDNPLTIAQAIALIDEEEETKQTMYVSGVVKSNSAWNTTYNNLNIFITDGTSDFELYACTLPEGFEPAQPTQNALVGKLLVGSGTGKKHNSTYELDKGSKVEKFLPAPAATGVEITCADEVYVGYSIDLTAKVTPLGASQEVDWEITEGSAYGTITEGKLEGTAEGSVTVKATAKGVSTVYATKTIAVKPVSPSSKFYRLITDPSTLADGDKIVIANADKDKGLGAYTEGNSCPAKDITASGEIISALGDACEIVIESAGNGRFYLKTGTMYLYAASSDRNQLKGKTSKDSTNGVWEFAYADNVMSIKAYGSSNRNNMRYNPNNGTPIFSCYASTATTGTALQVFKYS